MPERTSTESAVRLRSAVRALARRFSLSERADVACCGMTVAQAATVEVLRARGALRLGELGRQLGIRPSTLSRNLARLEQRGLVARRAEDGDARAARAVLTDAGVRAAVEVARQEEAFARDVLRRLPPERRERILEDLEALLAAVRGATESCCPGAYEHLMEPVSR
jgi:DNA-binding MarR family transcriptional regulator